jgi:hypothetical protein
MPELNLGPEPMRLIVEWTSDGDLIQAEREVKIQHKEQSDRLQTQIKYEQHESRERPQ